MGLLDEAIREHLELKRRRGADAGEISRAESEALGPVRRAPDGTPDLASIPGPPPTTMAAPDAVYGEAPPADEPEPDWEGETAILPAAPPAPAAYESRPTVAPPPSMPPPPHEPQHPPGFDDDEPELFEEPPPPPREKSRLLSGGRLRLRRRGEPPPEPEPEPDLEGFDPPTTPLPAQEPATGGYASPPSYYPPPAPAPARDVAPADDGPEGEDLLEETPEFLEETPDHDRLWFEQRPPRDFDFDK